MCFWFINRDVFDHIINASLLAWVAIEGWPAAAPLRYCLPIELMHAFKLRQKTDNSSQPPPPSPSPQQLLSNAHKMTGIWNSLIIDAISRKISGIRNPFIIDAIWHSSVIKLMRIFNCLKLCNGEKLSYEKCTLQHEVGSGRSFRASKSPLIVLKHFWNEGIRFPGSIHIFPIYEPIRHHENFMVDSPLRNTTAESQI